MRKGPNINISSNTVCRRLIAAGLHGRVAAKEQLLKLQNKVKRLKFSRHHQHWVTEQLNWVLWSDELKFELFGSKRHQVLCRRPGERYNTKCLQLTVKHGGGSVTVCGCVSAFGVRKLVKTNGMLTK